MSNNLPNGVLSGSSVLRQSRIRREEFDAANTEHQISLRNFLLTGNWGDVQFYTEAPYLTVPETVFRKMAHWALARVGR